MITPDTKLRFSIGQVITISLFLLGTGFTGGGIYIKLSMLADDVHDIQDKLVKIEKRLKIDDYAENKDTYRFPVADANIRKDKLSFE